MTDTKTPPPAAWNEPISELELGNLDEHQDHAIKRPRATPPAAPRFLTTEQHALAQRFADDAASALVAIDATIGAEQLVVDALDLLIASERLAPVCSDRVVKARDFAEEVLVELRAARAEVGR